MSSIATSPATNSAHQTPAQPVYDALTGVGIGETGLRYALALIPLMVGVPAIALMTSVRRHCLAEVARIASRDGTQGH